MSVKRYGLHIVSQFQINDQCCYIDTRVEKKGKWTRYTEYAALESRYNELAIVHDALLARHTALKEAVGKVVEMHRKGEGHVCTHYPSGRRALEALAAMVEGE